jgi:class 3 adenylate cyclase
LNYLAQRTIIAQAEEIQIERRRSDGLLNNILPTSIAERLKNQEGIIADSHSEVTVLFADIVGFTALSSRLSAPELVKKLNSVFTEFDLLCSELGLEKIKTIGDAYMVVGGIPNARPDHAKATVMMAIGMQKIIQKHREIHQDNLDIRIGVHSGPLVAGVIGKKKFGIIFYPYLLELEEIILSYFIPIKQKLDYLRIKLLPHYICLIMSKIYLNQF